MDYLTHKSVNLLCADFLKAVKMNVLQQIVWSVCCIVLWPAEGKLHTKLVENENGMSSRHSAEYNWKFPGNVNVSENSRGLQAESRCK